MTSKKLARYLSKVRLFPPQSISHASYHLSLQFYFKDYLQDRMEVYVMLKLNITHVIIIIHLVITLEFLDGLEEYNSAT